MEWSVAPRRLYVSLSEPWDVTEQSLLSDFRADCGLTWRIDDVSNILEPYLFRSSGIGIMHIHCIPRALQWSSLKINYTSISSAALIHLINGTGNTD